MATWQGSAVASAGLRAPASSASIYPAVYPPQPFLLSRVSSAGTLVTSDHASAFVATEYLAESAEQEAGTFDFWEDFHVVPRSFDFGNLLSDQSIPIEVFSAFRRSTHEWTAFVNGAGAGVELADAPTLPTLVPPLTGFQMTLEVSATGDPFVDDVLTFEFDIGTIEVPIEIRRIVLWGLVPEVPFAEILRFLTNIIRARAGNEQRIALRKNPRQSFLYPYKIAEGETRSVLENLLFDWQARVFGVPVWFEETELSAAATAGDTSIAVTQTAYRDFRVGGLVVVFVDQNEFDVLAITTIGASSIGLDSPLINSYPAGTQVFPLATCTVKPQLGGALYRVNLSTWQIEFENTDNDGDPGSTAAFASFNGKVFLDNGNSVRSGTVAETFSIEVEELDGETGIRQIETTWDRHKRGNDFVLRAQGRQAVWEARQLVRALRGRQVSFYVPRAQDDLEVVANLLNASNGMDVANYGYAQFVRNRQPKNVVRLTFNDGNPALIRTIIDSETISSAVDQLTVDTNWPRTILPSEIERIEYVEKVRIDSDEIRIEYGPSGNHAHIVFPIKAVFE